MGEFRTVSGTFLSERLSSVMVITAVMVLIVVAMVAMMVVVAEMMDGDEAVTEVGGYGGDGDDDTLHKVTFYMPHPS